MAKRNNESIMEINLKDIWDIVKLCGTVVSIFLGGFYLSSYYYDLKNEIKINAINIECNEKVNTALTREREVNSEKIEKQVEKLEALYKISEKTSK